MGAKCHHAEQQCLHPAALRSSAAGSFQAVTPLPPQAPEEESRPSTPRYGFAVVIPGRHPSRPCKPPASHSLRRIRTRPLRSRVRRLRSFARLRPAKPSGHPGHGRPGRWRRQCPPSRLCVRGFAPATNPCCPPQTARFCPHQRCSVLHLFEGLCLFAFTLVPRSAVSAALTPLGRPGPGR